jgi:hypothetical protein
MLEYFMLPLEFIFKEFPGYLHRISHAFQGIENSDTWGIFNFIWIPFNLFILIRILQPSLKSEGEPSRIIYCIAALMIWIAWIYAHFAPGQDSPLRYVREFEPSFLVIKVFVAYVNCLLLLKASVLIFRLYQMSFSMYRVESVIHLIFKDSNLKLILTTKSIMRYLVLYMLINAINQFVNPFEDLVIGSLFIWGFSTIPLLILCFFIAREALHKRHQSVFIEIVADQEYGSTGQGLEETLNLVASRRMGTELIVNEIFMGQIFRLAIAAIVTYGANRLLE